MKAWNHMLHCYDTKGSKANLTVLTLCHNNESMFLTNILHKWIIIVIIIEW